MDNKELIIIVGVFALLCVGLGAYFVFSSTPEYKNVTLNGISFEVPDSDANVTNQTDCYSIYNDSEKGIAIFVFDSTDAGLNDMGEAASFAAIRDSLQAGAQLQENSGVKYNHSDITNVYTYLTNYGHKNVFIVTKNKEDMTHILSSIDTDSITIELNSTDNNTANNTTSSDKKSSTSSKSVKEEDQVTSDGWNPKEHEVSREDLEEGMQRVEYDDGYHRVVDSDGNVLSYGY